MLVEERWTGWWAECDQCDWKDGPCNSQTQADALADVHVLAVQREEARPDDEL